MWVQMFNDLDERRNKRKSERKMRKENQRTHKHARKSESYNFHNRRFDKMLKQNQIAKN